MVSCFTRLDHQTNEHLHSSPWAQYEFKIADAYLKKINGEAPVRKAPKKQAGALVMSAEDEEMEAMMAESRTDADKDIPDGPMRPEEKRRLHWKGKTYLVSP